MGFSASLLQSNRKKVTRTGKKCEKNGEKRDCSKTSVLEQQALKNAVCKAESLRNCKRPV
jgi:hypothetical protein